MTYHWTIRTLTCISFSKSWCDCILWSRWSMMTHLKQTRILQSWQKICLFSLSVGGAFLGAATRFEISLNDILDRNDMTFDSHDIDHTCMHRTYCRKQWPLPWRLQTVHLCRISRMALPPPDLARWSSTSLLTVTLAWRSSTRFADNFVTGSALQRGQTVWSWWDRSYFLIQVRQNVCSQEDKRVASSKIPWHSGHVKPCEEIGTSTSSCFSAMDVMCAPVTNNRESNSACTQSWLKVLWEFVVYLRSW